jgi:type I restriction enzyme S subunit
MKYQTYPAYKDSGVEWLGDVPEHWEVVQSRRLFLQRKERARPDDEQLTASQKHGVIFQKEYMELENQRVVQVITGLEILKHVEPNDFVISMRSFQGGLEWCKYVGSVSSAYIGLIPIKWIIPDFFAYLFKCSPYIQALQSTSNLVRDGQALRFENFSQVNLLKIPNHEQQKIAQFLDHETAKIDTLIEKQQRLIELLKEKRQAVISHAVTKGLNPNAPMKESGVEWLGDVPEHWFVVPIKRICEVKDGTHETPQYVDKSELSFPLVTSKDFEGNFICFENAKYISKEDHLEIIKRSNTETGDILMSMIGGNIGKALIVGEDNNFSIKNVALFKTKQNDFLARYILFYLQSGLLDIQISLLSRGGAQGFLSLGDIRNLIFFKIPTAEIHEIVTYLNEHTIKFDELIGRANFAIELMQERRTALISAAVTGKIDVRDWGD